MSKPMRIAAIAICAIGSMLLFSQNWARLFAQDGIGMVESTGTDLDGDDTAAEADAQPIDQSLPDDEPSESSASDSSAQDSSAQGSGASDELGGDSLSEATGAGKDLANPGDSETADGGVKGSDAVDTKELSGNEINDDSWESYVGLQSSVAKDVTGGIRVEDIVEPTTEYAYAAFGKPDPFVAPYFKHRSSNSLEVPIVSVLQTYDLTQLRIHGIWHSLGGDRKALIMSDDLKVGIEVMKGDPIGKKGGKVMEVRPESVLIREFSITRDGTREFEDVELVMPSEFNQRAGGILVISEGEEPKIIHKDEPAKQGIRVIESVRGDAIENTQQAPGMRGGAGVTEARDPFGKDNKAFGNLGNDPAGLKDQSGVSSSAPLVGRTIPPPGQNLPGGQKPDAATVGGVETIDNEITAPAGSLDSETKKP